MNLLDLQLFKYTAKYQNITKAAKHFYISQSTLSRNIMSLETEIGAKLFERSNKNIYLTPAGEQLYKDCDLLIKHIETVASKVQTVAKNGKGTLRIALPSTLDYNVYMILKEFKKSFPNIEMLTESYDFDELTSSVLFGIYHAAFGYNFAIEPNEELIITNISNDTFSLIIPKDKYKTPSKDTIPQIIHDLPVILPSIIEPPFIKSLLHELDSYSSYSKIRKTYVNSTESAMLNTSLGLGFSIIPTSVFYQSLNSDYVEKIDLNDFNTTASIVMITKKNTTNVLTNKFFEYVESNLSNQN